MSGPMMSKVLKSAAAIVFAVSVLLSAQAQAQSIVGTWTKPGLTMTFQADGRWTYTENDAAILAHCGAPKTGGGTYTASGGSISLADEGGWCSSSTTQRAPPEVGTGSYSISGSTLVMNLQFPEGPRDLTLSAQAQSQDLIGSWTEPRFRISLQGNGRWLLIVTDPSVGVECGGSASIGGPYTAFGGSISMSVDSATCGSRSEVAAPQFFASGTYSISGSTLVAHLQGTYDSAEVTLNAIRDPTTGGSVIAPSTPLPSPPTTQAVYTVPTGTLPSEATQVTATGTFGSANLKVTLDIVKVLQSLPATGFAASTYNVYVAALVPGAVFGTATPVWYVKPKVPGNWGPLQSPIAAFLENVAQSAVNNQVVIDILTNTDISLLVGAEIYIGYGTDDQEMLAAGRYRGVYMVQ